MPDLTSGSALSTPLSTCESQQPESSAQSDLYAIKTQRHQILDGFANEARTKSPLTLLVICLPLKLTSSCIEELTVRPYGATELACDVDGPVSP